MNIMSISNNNIAPLNTRYVGLYHYSTYWEQWDKIINVNKDSWLVRQVNLEGHYIGNVRCHNTSMNAGHFATRPFKIIGNVL